MNETMTSRQRVAAAVRHEVTDRVPLQFWWTSEASSKAKAFLGVKTDAELHAALGLDVTWVWADYIGKLPENKGPGTRSVYWGYVLKQVEYTGGVYEEYCHYPLAGATSVQQVHDYAWPNPADFDYDAMPGKFAPFADIGGQQWLGVGESSIFERSWALVGFEKFLEMLLVDTDIAMAIMEHVNNFYIEQTLNQLRVFKGRADMVYIADDLGTQINMLISPKLWRQTVKPLQKKFNDAIKAEFPNVVFHYHSCGSIPDVIGDLAEVGVDILNPIQPKANGMDADTLARLWGDKISFCGGLDIQELLPFGTVEEVKAECKRLIRTLGKGGGYILAPAHAIQVDTPPENVLAIVEAANETPPTK